ncbi:MAG: DUF2318 domain-containing protein [Desulfuromonas sp.]|nr:MAG: DUF2318 domain-containing protein [Desulfuromonas sp.]
MWILLILAAAAIGAWFAWNRPVASHAAVTPDSDGVIRFAVDDFADGKAHYFSFKDGGSEVRFFLVRSTDGVIRAALDSCDVCYREQRGYRQEGDDMVCNNCNQHFRTDLVNVVKGGCNPVPLERQQVGNQILVRAADLANGFGYFALAVR